MQGRYCECGCHILVGYVMLPSKRWLTRFWIGGGLFGRPASACPYCGRGLSIDGLR